VAAARRSQCRPAGDLNAALDGLLSQKNETLRVAALQLASAWKLTSLQFAAQSVARDGTESDVASGRRAALEALPALGGASDRDLLLEFSGVGRPALRVAAITAPGHARYGSSSRRSAAAFLSGASGDADAAEIVRLRF